MIIHSRLARHISVLLGYFYPALASAKTAVQQDPTAFTQWMTYWVVMSVFALAEIFVDFFVSWVPFYYEAKIVLIVWLAMPRYQGASQIYHRLLHPYLDKYEGDIDNGLEEMRAGASRRIQSLGASAASEIAKAVSRQSSSAKDLMLARVLGLAAAGGAEALGDRPVQSAPTSPLLRRASEAEGGARKSSRRHVEEEEEEEEDGEDEEEITAANASMLLDFTEVMKVGVFVQARSSFTGEIGDEGWRSRQIRLLHGTQCCMIEDEGVPGAGTDGEQGGAGGVREEQRFQVLAVETEAHAQAKGAPLLVLRTDRGRVELAPPGRDDRDSMLIGFELLLSSFGSGSPAKETLFSEGGGGAAGGGLPDRDSAAQHRSRRWEEGLVGRGGMTLESSDEESEGEEDGHRHR